MSPSVLCRLIGLHVAVVIACCRTAPIEAAPLRVLPPARSGSASPAVQCLTEHLVERLAQCQGIDIVQGDRAGRVNAWLNSGALDLTEAERWRRLSALVAVDALITIAASEDHEGAGATTAPAQTHDRALIQAVEVRIFSAGGMTPLRGLLPIASATKPGAADLPHAVSALAERLGRELKLSEGDVKTLAAVRIDDPAAFRTYYAHLTASSSWPTNPYVPAVLAVTGPSKPKPHWAEDAAMVRVAASYIQWVNHGRQSDKLSAITPITRAPLLRLMGTAHEEETYPLLRLPRGGTGEAMLADIELVLLQIAGPLIAADSSAAAESAVSARAAVKPEKDAAKRGDGSPTARDATTGEDDDLLDLSSDTKSKLGEAIDKPNDLTTRTGRADYTPQQRLGALRMLGVMRSAKGAALLERAATSSDRALRETAAASLGRLTDATGLEALKRLAQDGDDKVAFLAARSLAERCQPPADLATRGKAMLTQADPYRTWAAEALARHAAHDDTTLRRQLAEDPAPSVRQALRRARLGANVAPEQRLAEVMTESDGRVIIDAIQAAGAVVGQGSPDNVTRQRLITLANDPDAAVAEAARQALHPMRPTETIARAQFDLAVREPFWRHAAIATLKASNAPEARSALLAACTNPEPHTRLAALQALAAIDPAGAAAPLLTALADPHRLVRFHAAVLLASTAAPPQADALRKAISAQRDRATALYLADALARAEGKPPPPSTQPRANPIDGESNVVWLWGSLGHAPDSPYRHHFKPSHGNHVRDDTIHDVQKAGHAAGSAYVYNIGPMGEPGVGVVDPSAQDGYWLYLDDQLDTPHLPYIDGVDLMTGGVSPQALWTAGWRYFCEQCGIDPARVAGQIKNLNPYETRAWTVWSSRRCVEGRNRVYDYIKLKFGKLHPGFGVGQSVGRSSGVTDFDLRFDFAFVRDQGDDARRDTYDIIRRARTVWPKRRVVWHGEALEVENLTVIRHDFKTPSKLITGRHHRAYTNALTAWMAGADTGWSSVWVFRALNWDPAGYAGAFVSPEDLLDGGPRLRAAVDMAFDGVQDVFRDQAALDTANRRKLALPPTDQAAKMDELLDGIEKPSGADAALQRVAMEKERMLLGFGIYGRHVLNLAHLFASLPRLQPQAEVLVIAAADKAGERAARGSAGDDLPAAYDALFDINDVTRLDLQRYRFIMVSDPPELEDAAMAAILRWLKDTPGVLYVHRDLTADNTRQAGTPERFDGKLTQDWPWEGDMGLTPIVSAPSAAAKRPQGAMDLRTLEGTTLSLPEATRASTIAITGKAAQPLLLAGDAPVLAVWRRADFKGAVVIDSLDGGGVPYRQAVRRALTELHRTTGVGMALPDAIRHERVETDGFTADSSAGDSNAQTIRGPDLLTGELDPVVGPAKSAAFVAREFTGRFAAAGNGVSVLCDRPIRAASKTPGGLTIECSGLMQAASQTGRLDAVPVSGAPLIQVKEDQQVRWIVMGRQEGVAAMTVGDGKTARPGTVLFIRCDRPIRLSPQ